MGKRTVEIVFLEMRRPPPGEAPPPPGPGVAVRRLERPTAQRYRELYTGVGGPWLWWERNLLSDEALLEIVGHPDVEVWVLEVEGETAGYVELDRRVAGETEIAYFGLMPDFIGRGLGRYLLAWAVRRGFAEPTGRVWLHTCSLDHPRALPNYKAAGFEEIDRVTKVVDIPD